MEHEVFISYSSSDKTIADAICHTLEQHEISCWIAPRDVRPGIPYAREIISGIKYCHVMVLVFTRYSNTSEHVGNEIDVAFNSGKTIIPFLIDETPMNEELKYYLARKHWLVAYPDYEQRFGDLVNAVSNILGRNVGIFNQKLELPNEIKLDTVNLKVLSNLDCRVLVDCEEMGIAHANTLFKIPLKCGDYYIQYVSIENESDTITTDITIEHDVLEKIDLVSLKRKREEKYRQEVEYVPYIHNGKCGYVIEETMEIVIRCIYEAAFNYSEGLAKVQKNGKYGFIDRDGNVIIPCEYDSADNCYKGIISVTKEEKHGAIDKRGNVIIPFEYNFIYCDSDLILVVKEKRSKVYNKKGEEVFNFEYEDVHICSENLAPIKVNGKWGVWDNNGDNIVPCIYDNIGSFFEGFAQVTIGDKSGFIDTQGIEVIPCKYDHDDIFYPGEKLFCVKINDKMGLVNLQGIEVIPCIYDNIGSGWGENLISVKLNNKWGFVDKKGTEIIPCIYDKVSTFGVPFKGMSYVRIKDKDIFINKCNEEIITLNNNYYCEFPYSIYTPIDDYGMIEINDTDWNTGYMDKFGNTTFDN